jgi:uncharacterized membrane protein YoaT (DUF817 family)
MNREFEVQIWRWFELFTLKQITEIKFLKLFAHYFVEKISIELWFCTISCFSSHEKSVRDNEEERQLKPNMKV